MSKNFLSLTVISLATLLFALGIYVTFLNNSAHKKQSPTPAPTASESVPVNNLDKNTNAGLANPASVYCKDQGGESTINTASDGSQSGQCVFSDGRTCDEWEFFRTKVCK